MNHSGKQGTGGKNLLEWTVFGLSTCLIIATAATLVHELLGETKPVDLSVALGEFRKTGDWWSTSVTVENRGGKVAEDIEVIVTSEDAGEAAACHFDYLPGGAIRKGTVLFANPPMRKPQAQVIGFRAP